MSVKVLLFGWIGPRKSLKERTDCAAEPVLATVARAVKDIKTSEKFYRLNVEQAKKLKSGQKLSQAYLGLTGLFLRLFHRVRPDLAVGGPVEEAPIAATGAPAAPREAK